MIFRREVIASRYFSAGVITAMQHAVNAEPDAHLLLVRLQVDVAGAPLNRGQEQRVHQPDDRRLAPLPLERRRVDLLRLRDDFQLLAARQVLQGAHGEVRAPGRRGRRFAWYLSMASRTALSDATTASTCSPVMNFTSSMANTLVGSAMASVSVVPVRPTGMTWYFEALSAGISRTMAGSRSNWAR